MARIFPRGDDKLQSPPLAEEERTASSSDCATVLTVWKKSSMSFDCMDGFTVYDSKGWLVFRVENYTRSCRLRTHDLVLMDGEGRPLIALRPKVVSMHEQWDGVFIGGSGGTTSGRDGKHAFSIRKRHMAQNKGNSWRRNSTSKVTVTKGVSRSGTAPPEKWPPKCVGSMPITLKSC